MPSGAAMCKSRKTTSNFSSLKRPGASMLFCEGHSLNTGGSQNFPNHFADRCLIIHDQTSSLHVTLHFLAFAGSCGLRAPTLLNARCAVRCDGKQACCREKPELRR